LYRCAFGVAALVVVVVEEVMVCAPLVEAAEAEAAPEIVSCFLPLV
jgi:hypothetical protein